MEQIVQTSTVVVHSIHTVRCVHCTIQRITMHVGIPSIVRAELRANTFGQVFGTGFWAMFWARFAEFTIYLYTVAGVLI